MDLESKIKSQFPKVNKAYFEKEFNLNFLRVEVKFRDMESVEQIARDISEYLDENYETSKEYYLDVFSEGSSPEFTIDEAINHLNKTIEIILVSGEKYIGKLEEVLPESLLIKENIKGRLKKHCIKSEEIESMKIHVSLI